MYLATCLLYPSYLLKHDFEPMESLQFTLRAYYGMNYNINPVNNAIHISRHVITPNHIWKHCNLCCSLIVEWTITSAIYGSAIIYAVHLPWHGW